MKPLTKHVSKSVSSATLGIGDRNPNSQIVSSSGNIVECVISDSEGNEEGTQCGSCASSFSDDSGFSSDFENIVMMVNFDSDDESKKTEIICVGDAPKCDNDSHDCLIGHIKIHEPVCRHIDFQNLHVADNSICEHGCARFRKGKHLEASRTIDCIDSDCDDEEVEDGCEFVAVEQRNCNVHFGGGGLVNKKVCDGINHETVTKKHSNFYCNGGTAILSESDLLNNCSEMAVQHTSGSKSKDSSIDKKSSADTEFQTDNVFLHNCVSNDDIGRKNNRNNISTNKRTRNRKTPNFASSSLVVAPSNLQTRRRGCRVHDPNNNDSSSRNLNSFLGKAPFKLQNCFHDQGLLCLIVCIIYTLILMVIICVLSKIMETLKSYVGVQNLKKIRRYIASYRQSHILADRARA